jgi:hypothetical protein
MGVTVFQNTQSIAAGTEFRPDFRPNDRFGPRGGTVRIRAVIVTGGAVGDILETLFVGNTMVMNRNPIPLERAANAGVDNFVPAKEAPGLAHEVVDLRYFNTNAAARSVSYFVEIEDL